MTDALVCEERKPGIGGVDIALVILFLLGIYTSYVLQITADLPFPSMPAGIAGIILLWRRRRRIARDHVAFFFLLLIVLLASIVAVGDLEFLKKRFTGLVQLTYSLIIGYAFYLTLIEATREQVAAIFLGFALAILVGCALEDAGPLRPLSDAVRDKIYPVNLYDADIRDELLYGRVRPKLFTSEPSSVTFAFSLFAYAWFLASRWQWKLVAYLALIGVAILVAPGPTLMLMLLLVIPYYLFVGGLRSPRRAAAAVGLSAALLVAFVALGQSIFSARVNQMSKGGDASTFYRVQGPALVAAHVAVKYPIAGAGLTGESFIANDVADAYRSSPEYSADWDVTETANVLTNYFWLHWIYFGPVFGVIVLAAMSLWLEALDIPWLAFCWIVWAVFGQASGAYVGPKTWSVMFIVGACCVLARRDAVATRATDESIQSYTVRGLPLPTGRT